MNPAKLHYDGVFSARHISLTELIHPDDPFYGRPIREGLGSAIFNFMREEAKGRLMEPEHLAASKVLDHLSSQGYDISKLDHSLIQSGIVDAQRKALWSAMYQHYINSAHSQILALLTRCGTRYRFVCPREPLDPSTFTDDIEAANAILIGVTYQVHKAWRLEDDWTPDDTLKSRADSMIGRIHIQPFPPDATYDDAEMVSLFMKQTHIIDVLKAI